MKEIRCRSARASLEGLSVGDAFGEQFFGPPETVGYLIENRALPKAPWRYTDDTVMALSIVEVLETSGRIDTDLLPPDPRRGRG